MDECALGNSLTIVNQFHRLVKLKYKKMKKIFFLPIIFHQIYLRDPAGGDINDLSAIMLITYGLLPAERNLESEMAAVSIFEDIFVRSPHNAIDWNIVRAIAYSGAVR